MSVQTSSGPGFGKRGWVITGALLVAGIAVDFLLGRDIPGFDAVFAFASCVTIILVSKWLGKRWLQRDEAYYGGGSGD